MANASFPNSTGKYFFHIVLLFFFLIIVAPQQVNAQNLVLNGSFSAGDVNWSYFAPGTMAEAGWATESSYGGQVTSTNLVGEIDGQSNLRQTNITVTPGQPYLVSLRASRRTGNGAAQAVVSAYIKIYNGATDFLLDTFTRSNTAFDLSCETFQFTPTTNTISIDLGPVNNTSSLGLVVDDITITPQNQTLTFIGQQCQGGAFSVVAPYYPNNPDNNYTNYAWTGPDNITGSAETLTVNNATQASSGQYSCTMTLNTCLTVTGTINLNFTPSDITLRDTICDGESYNFFGRLLTTTGTYDTLLPSTTGGCDSNIHLHLQVNPIPQASVSPTADQDLCEGQQTVISAIPVLNGAAYQWYLDNNFTGSTTTSVAANQPGSYSYQVTLNGCTNHSDSVTVRVHPAPAATIYAANDNVPECALDTITLFADSVVGYSYRWTPAYSFSLLSNIYSNRVYGQFSAPATMVTLTVTNGFGCSASDSMLIQTIECCSIGIANAFSPNGDGLNDYFKPILQSGQTLINMAIYNRYGNKIFEGQGNHVLWDGRNSSGTEATSGVYMYYIQYYCVGSNKIFTRKGDLTLLR